MCADRGISVAVLLTHPDRNTQNERKATQSNAKQRTQGKQNQRSRNSTSKPKTEYRGSRTLSLELTLGTFFFTLRRSRAAMGRYQGTSGAAWAAAGRVRRPRGPPCEIPGKGKGLRSLPTLKESIYIGMMLMSKPLCTRDELECCF